MRGPVAIAAATVVLAAGCGSDAAVAPTARASEEDPAAAPYQRSITVACLVKRGASVRQIRPTNTAFQALQDVARGQAREVLVKNRRVALAFARNIAGAELLVELLTVPTDSYRVERRGNVVLLYRARDARTLAIVVRCLRP